jgi:hypothetical protein
MIESTHYTAEFYSGQQTGSLSSAQRILPLVNDVFHPASVIDVGCGVGYWLSVWQQLGVKDIRGVEGPYVTPDLLKVDKALVQFQDLKQPLNIQRKFDLAMSLEVAEHLPDTHARQFVQTLTSMSDVVLFSAAVPGQEGTYHINEQMPEYWAAFFQELGFVPVDFIRPQVWGEDEVVEWWYQQNILLYIRRERLADFPALSEAYRNTRPRFLFRLHPWLYNYKLQHIRRTKTWVGYTHWKLYLFKKSFYKLINKK